MAVLTVTTTGAEDARIAAAFGHKLGLGGPATLPQIKAALIAWVTQVVNDDEARAAALAANPTPIAPA